MLLGDIAEISADVTNTSNPLNTFWVDANVTVNSSVAVNGSNALLWIPIATGNYSVNCSVNDSFGLSAYSEDGWINVITTTTSTTTTTTTSTTVTTTTLAGGGGGGGGGIPETTTTTLPVNCEGDDCELIDEGYIPLSITGFMPAWLQNSTLNTISSLQENPLVQKYGGWVYLAGLILIISLFIVYSKMRKRRRGWSP